MKPRGFGRHGVDEHGQLWVPRSNERISSTFPPVLVEENRETIERLKRAREKESKP